MTTNQIITTVSLLTLVACTSDQPTLPVLAGERPMNAKAPPFTTYAYALTGDVTTEGTLGTAQAKTGKPFLDVSVSNVTVRLGSPSGDIGVCRTGDGVYDTTFGAHVGDAWFGTLTLHRTGTLGFNGTRGGGSEQVQFSVADANGPVQSPGPTAGSYTLAYTNARMFFGAQSTHYDAMYRCVNITVAATP